MGTIPTSPTFVAGEKLTAAKLNQLRDVQNFWALTPRVSAYANTTTSIPNSGSTPTVIALDAEVYDIVQSGDSPSHDNSTDNTRLIVRTTGKYEITGQVAFTNNATGVRSAYVNLNSAGTWGSGTNLFASTQSAVSGGFNTAVPIPTIEVPLNAGDYIELFGLQTSGGALNVSTGQGATFLRMKLAGS